MRSWDGRTAGGASWRSANRLSTHHDLDDLHGAAAAGTDEGRRWRDGAGVVVRFRSRHIEQGPRRGQIPLSPGIGQQSVVTDTVEASWQHEAPHELFGGEHHRLVAGPALGAVVLPAEGHPLLIHRHQSPVRDGHPMSVTGEVSQDGLETGKGTLGIDHPLDAAQRYQPPAERAGIGQGACSPKKCNWPAR